MKTLQTAQANWHIIRVTSCLEQIVNQYWNIAPQHNRVPVKKAVKKMLKGKYLIKNLKKLQRSGTVMNASYILTKM